MFWITQDPSSGSIDSYIIKITRNGSTLPAVCVVGVWRHIQDCNGEGKLNESWTKVKLSDFHEILKNVAEGKRISPVKLNVSFVTACFDLFPVEVKKRSVCFAEVSEVSL
jgi:hypothetical protein